MEDKWIDFTELEVGHLYIEGIEEKWRKDFETGSFPVIRSDDNPFLVITKPQMVEDSVLWGATVLCDGEELEFERYVPNHRPVADEEWRRNFPKEESFHTRYQEVTE